jgi:hypothetical protein
MIDVHLLKFTFNFTVVQPVPFTVSPSTVAQSHSKPASVETFCDSCRAHGHYKMAILYMVNKYETLDSCNCSG